MYRETTIEPGVPGHKTNAECARRLVVNSEGEVSVWVNGQWYAMLGSIRLDELCRRNGLDWQTECQHYNKDPDHPLRLLVRAESNLLLYRHVTDPAERAAVLKIWNLQNPVARRGRYRVYGGVEDGVPYAHLVEEAIGWIENNDAFWDNLIDVVEKAGGVVRTMDETDHLDKYYPARGEEGERETDELVEPKPGSQRHYPEGAKWFVGKDHGRAERQVEMLWPVYHLSEAEVEALVKRLEPVTEEIWNTAGVCVC